MRILKILGQKWTLKFKSKVVSDGQLVAGTCDFARKELLIGVNPYHEKKIARDENISRTYWHEILHAIFYESDIRDQSWWTPDIEHFIIAPLATALAANYPLEIKETKKNKIIKD